MNRKLLVCSSLVIVIAGCAVSTRQVNTTPGSTSSKQAAAVDSDDKQHPSSDTIRDTDAAVTTKEHYVPESASERIDSVQLELDNFYTLMSYAVVYKNWQSDTTTQKRGHNIGCVVVNSNDTVVYWARNCNKILSNGTQHGEVRAMLGYINAKRSYNLKNHTIYTSLEPCAQCAGMMTLQSIERTVYGQKDPDFGDAFERLQCKLGTCQGCTPYPRSVISVESKCRLTAMLDSTYHVNRDKFRSITGFLLSDSARVIYQAADSLFRAFTPRHSQNEGPVNYAKQFLTDSVTTSYKKLGVDF